MHAQFSTDISKVGVVGCGLMGSGIAQVSAMTGFQTVVCDVSQDVLNRGLAGIEKSLAKLAEKGRIAGDQKARTLAALKPTLELQELGDCDLVIEAIVENLDLKGDLIKKLDRSVKQQAIFATNTSSLSVTELMGFTQRRSQFLGLHFFNPVPLMPLVEVVPSVVTDSEVVRVGLDFIRRLGKTPILASDRAGFIVNRLLVPYLLDAVRALEEGFGSIEDIDRGMKLGCNHPMGPFTLLDFVGNDTTYYIAEILFREYREKRFAPPPLLKRMVLAGLNGRKSGRGFYDYSDPANPKPNKLV
jgi:3-hydroxybutyryl-CoA dehydrogenase